MDEHENTPVGTVFIQNRRSGRTYLSNNSGLGIPGIPVDNGNLFGTAGAYVTANWEVGNNIPAGAAVPSIATTIHLVYTLAEMQNYAIEFGGVVYCLENNKTYQYGVLSNDVQLAQGGIVTGWTEVVIDKTTRRIWTYANIRTPEPEPQAEVNLTEEQKEKYEEFEKGLLLQTTPGRLDQEDKPPIEEPENDNVKPKPPEDSGFQDHGGTGISSITGCYY